MNGSVTNSRWRLGALFALASACGVVDHPVGAGNTQAVGLAVSIGMASGYSYTTATTTTTTTTTGAAVATGVPPSEAWSEDILQECRGGAPDVVATCGSYASDPVPQQYSLAVVIDQSLAMTEPLGDRGESRWEAARRGLANLYRDYESLDTDREVALVFSNPPQADSCEIRMTIVPALAAADSIEEAFEQNEPEGSLRPLAPSLRAAFAYLAGDPPPPNRLLVLITAGAPDACGAADPVAELAAMAGSELGATPDHPVPTYVIELGSEVLDSVAEAGGTQRAASITGGDVAAQIEQAVRNALDEVRFSKYCTFENPFGNTFVTDLPALIGSSYAALEQEQVPRIDGAEACDTSPEGGYYLVASAPTPTFRYCPCSCARFARFGARHTLTAPAELCEQ